MVIKTVGLFYTPLIQRTPMPEKQIPPDWLSWLAWQGGHIR
ncbi:hypothetical protein [Bartonella sp. DGB2]